MHLLFRAMRPLSPETGASDHDHVSSVSQPVQACRGQQQGAEQVGPLLQGVATEWATAPPTMTLAIGQS